MLNMDNNNQRFSLNLPTPVPSDAAQPGGSPVVPPQAPQDTSVPSSENQSLHITADDRDLIEQEWITRTEQLISQHVHDPHVLSQKMYELRAEYVSKRYGKALKQEGQV